MAIPVEGADRSAAGLERTFINDKNAVGPISRGGILIILVATCENNNEK
jgi:hypothetical protein